MNRSTTNAPPPLLPPPPFPPPTSLPHTITLLTKGKSTALFIPHIVAIEHIYNHALIYHLTSGASVTIDNPKNAEAAYKDHTEHVAAYWQGREKDGCYLLQEIKTGD